jgi:hypothetical protein
VRVPLEDLVAADCRNARRVGPSGPQRNLDGVAPARGGVVQVDVGEVGDPAVHGAGVMGGALGGRELVEGAHGGERQFGVVFRDGEGPVVVDEVEEAPAAGGLGCGSCGDRCGEGEVDDGDGDAGRSERRGGVGVWVDEELRDGGGARFDEAAHAGAGLVKGLEERGAVGLGRRRRWRRHGCRRVDRVRCCCVERRKLKPGRVDEGGVGEPWTWRLLIQSPSSVTSSPPNPSTQPSTLSTAMASGE